jgi:hypothetical protein
MIKNAKYKTYLETKLDKMHKILLLIFLSISGLTSFAQNYPEVILPNSTKTIESNNDTLWILKNSQLDNAIIAKKKLAVELEITKELKGKIAILEKKGITQDSLVNILTKDRDYYVTNWKTCTDDVEGLLRQSRRQKLFSRLAYAGIVVAFIGGFLLGK